MSTNIMAVATGMRSSCPTSAINRPADLTRTLRSRRGPMLSSAAPLTSQWLCPRDARTRRAGPRLTSFVPGANLSRGGRKVFGLYSSLLTLALSSVAWPSAVGVSLGILVGVGLGYLLIDRVLRAQAATPQPALVRRLASACCLVWGLVLPLGMAAAGLVWGVGFGVGTLVEGPVSTTVRETTHTWLVGANGIGTAVLRRLPLAKRLSERELLTVVQAAPEWISEALDQDRV